MRTVTYSRIVSSIARIYGESALTSDDAATVAEALDTLRIEQVWNFANWRELDVIEERRFAADYSASTTYAINDVVYYSGTDTYYRCTAASTGNLPTDEDYWIEATGFTKTIDFVQAGKTAIGTVNAVTSHDPRLQPSSANIPYVRREDALQVVGTSQTSVWVRFTRRAPRFTSAAYAGGTTYALGDLAYDATTGLVYESLQAANTGNAVTDTDYWQPQEIPYFAMGFLVRAGLADLYESKDQADKADRHEAKAYEKLDDAYYAQNRREGQFTRMEVLAPAASQNEPNTVSGNLAAQDGDFIEIE